MTSWASSATCRWPSPARHTPCRHMSPPPRRGPAATLSSTSMTWTITPLNWTCSSLKKRSSSCWTNRPLETSGKPHARVSSTCLPVCLVLFIAWCESKSFLDSSRVHQEEKTVVSNLMFLFDTGTSLWRTTWFWRWAQWTKGRWVNPRPCKIILT